MDHFNFTGQRVDDAFRKLCTHLYLHGETQVIDRILAEFARRFWDCNPGSIFRSQDVVYAVSYSMLLLNTDLHVAKNHTKMSKSDFVKNTLSVVESCARASSFEQEGSGSGTRIDGRSKSIESYGYPSQEELTHTLKEMYTSIKHSQILQHVEIKSPKIRRPSVYSSQNSSNNEIVYKTQPVGKSSKSTHFKKSHHWELQRKMSGNSLNLSQMSTRSATPDLFFTNARPPPPQPPASNAKINPTEAAVYPYQKVGVLIRKHLYERTDKKAAHRTWKECLVVVERGEIKMYKADKTKSGGEGVDLTDASLQLGTLLLRHCLAVTLPPPGYSPSRPHAFALQLPSGGVYIFQAQSAQLISEWVVICNFWSARETKDPLPGGICSIDYGWGTTYGDGKSKSKDVQEDDDLVASILPGPDSYQPISSRQLFSEQQAHKQPVSLQEWKPPAPPMVRSILGEDQQLEALMRHITSLDTELVEHMEYRGIVHRRFPPKTPLYAKAFSNWERKSQYLLRELIKYQTYADILKKTLAANRGLSNPDDLLGVPEDDVLEFEPADPKVESSIVDDSSGDRPLSGTTYGKEEFTLEELES
ncbi:hypothetical protein K502DRAFT_323233 [Neoconidiobolus thromboides FSU 785]|nr:hypothetical protein K502DRAFT_323233 [Neoconidiobolus thromboides FSU 785]